MNEKLVLVSTFTDKVDETLSKQGLTRAELARKANISQSVLSLIWSGSRQPGPDVCLAVARALRVNPITVYQWADLLPPDASVDEDSQEMMHLFTQMSEEDQETLIGMARFFVERRANKKPGQARPAEV